MTLQEQFNSIKSGKGNKAQFLKQAKSLFPQYFNQYSDFDTATNVLKSKQIISEAAGGVISKGFDIWDWKKILAEEVKAEEKKVSKEVEDVQNHAYDNKDMKNADNINFNEIMKGFYAELKDPKNHDMTGDEIKAMVVKNLAKDPLFYTKDGMFGTKGVGYTNEAPALGVPKEAKGKHKSSGYGDLKENKETPNEKIERYESYTYTLDGKEVTPEIAFYNNLLKAELDGELYRISEPVNGKIELNPIKGKTGIYTESVKENKLQDEGWLVKSNDEDTKYIVVHTSKVDNRSNRISKIYKDKKRADKRAEELNNKLTEGIEEYDNMSDQEIIQWAYDDGYEDFIVYDGEDGLANREEVLTVLLGLEDKYEEEPDTEAEHDFGPDDLDPAGGYGPLSHMESLAEQKLRSLIRNIIKEELNKESDMGQRLAAEYGTSDYIDPTSIKYSEDEEGSWNLEFIMEIPKNEVMDMDIKEADKYFSKEYGVNSYSGPGAPFSKVYADTKDGEDYWIVSIYAHGGYDI